MKYVIMMHVDPAVLERLTEEQQRMIGEGHAAFMASTKATGEFIATQALADPSRSKVVRGSDDQPEVTDGPFVEGKEVVSGYAEIEVADLDEALAVARVWPGCPVVEIRPIT